MGSASGYAKQILRIDLTARKIEKEPLDMGMAKELKTGWRSKSPLTGLVQTAASSGLGVHLKWAGYDSVVIAGKADRPVYIIIFSDTVI